LAFELDLGGGRVNRRAKYLVETSFSSQVPDTHTRSELTALPGPLKWSVKIQHPGDAIRSSSAAATAGCQRAVKSVNILLALTLRRMSERLGRHFTV